MADQDTPQSDLEAQGEAQEQPAPAPQPEARPTPEVPTDDFNPRQGETVEAYAARVRSEMNWRDKQLGRQHRKIKESEERLAKAQEFEAENQRLRDLAQAGARSPASTGTQPPPQPQSSVPPRPVAPVGGVDPTAMAAARRQIGIERTAETLGKNTDWPAASANFEKAGGIPMELMDAVLDTDDPAHVLVTLGKDMNKFQQVMDLPEGRRRAALIKIGMETSEKPEAKVEVKKPSSAPSPTSNLPAGGGAVAAEGDIDLYDQKYATSEYDDAWFRKRAEQKLNSRGRPWSVGGKGGSPSPRG